MKRFIIIFSQVILILLLGNTVSAEESSKHKKNLSTYFVAFQKEVDHGLIKSKGDEVKRTYKSMPVVAAKLPEQAVRALSKNPVIAYIEKDHKVQAIGQVTEQTTEQLTPWGISTINVPSAHEQGVKGNGIKIGIIDTGIDYTHEDLYVQGGVTFVEGTQDYMDDNGHGTHVTGTIAALDNSFGVVGVAPESEIFGIKVLNKYGDGTYSDVVAGIEWAIENDMDIINMSLGGDSKSNTLKKAVKEAYKSGILIIAAAGNDGYNSKGSIDYPAKYKSVVSVGSIDEQYNRTFSSSVGKELEIVAPGTNIYSTIPGSYGTSSGTSMAAPHVVGVAALAWENNKSFINQEIRDSLNNTVISLGDPFLYGNGVVNAIITNKEQEEFK